jgi:hypothetical protein
MIIVARDRPELYEYFRAGLGDFIDVQVIVDRRIPDDRDEWVPADVATSAWWQPDVYDELTLRGFVIRRIQSADWIPLSSAASRHPLAEDEGRER